MSGGGDEVQRGQEVWVRDASGEMLPRLALSAPENGEDFPVVWVTFRDTPNGEGWPWPAEDVFARSGETGAGE